MAIYELPLIPTKAFLHWTFGRDTVVRKQTAGAIRYLMKLRYGEFGQLSLYIPHSLPVSLYLSTTKGVFVVPIRMI
jgi:hypothetical protein